MTDTGRFTCSLNIADEPACTNYARVTVVDLDGERARACPKHALAALEGIRGGRIDWADSKGLNEYEAKALEIAEHQGRLAR